MRRDPTYLSRMHMRVLGGRDEEIDPQTVDWSSGSFAQLHRPPGFRRL